jgi:hypothetical protein
MDSFKLDPATNWWVQAAMLLERDDLTQEQRKYVEAQVRALEARKLVRHKPIRTVVWCAENRNQRRGRMTPRPVLRARSALRRTRPVRGRRVAGKARAPSRLAEDPEPPLAGVAL